MKIYKKILAVLFILLLILSGVLTYREKKITKKVLHQKENIVIISNFKSSRELKVFEQQSSLSSFSLISVDDFPEQFSNQTFFFLLSNSLQISCPFFPKREYSKISERYYESIAIKWNVLKNKKQKET